MSRRENTVRFVWKSAAMAIGLALSAVVGCAQEPARGTAKPQMPSLAQTLGELQAQIRDLNLTLAAMRAEAARSQTETLGLRHELEQTRAQLASVERGLEAIRSQPTTAAGAPVPVPESGAATGAMKNQVERHLAKLEEDQQLLSAKIDEQGQAKVESASKYRLRLSGVALLNVFGNRGSVDSVDLPNLALRRGELDSHAVFGATMRQSQVGLEVFGPRLGGAKTSANMQFDFFGGFPSTLDGVNSGLVRLRVGTVRLDWSRTSVVVGQDTLFFSPLSPTSLASVALPAFAYSGNLWTWTPQIRVEHRLDLSENSSLSLQGGILDPLTGEPPLHPFYRSPQAGEKSGKPAYGARLAWAFGGLNRPLTVGAGGYYSRQNWALGRHVDGWAGTADWSVPLGRWFALTGEFYRGRALGGLGGGIGRSVLYDEALVYPTTTVLGLNSTGGWTQLKFKPVEKLEFNTAFGQDNPLAHDLRQFYESQSYFDASLARNQTAMVNFIYRPRSDLLFSAEYRRLHTTSINGARQTADHVNMSVGVLF